MPRNLSTISGARLLLMIRDGIVKSRSDLLNALHGAQNEAELDVTQGLGFDHALANTMAFISKFYRSSRRKHPPLPELDGNPADSRHS